MASAAVPTIHHALTEQDFRNRRARHIVYGHTHHSEVVPLDASYAEGYVLHQAYFNSGTWRRVHEQTQFAPREHEFIAADTLTYLAFFKDDERKGRPYETWTGTLGLTQTVPANYRVDAAAPTPGAPSHASGQPISTPSVPIRSPHFAVPTSPTVVSGESPCTDDFQERLESSGAVLGRAGVAGVYCVHGTFAGGDPLGLLTELARVASRR